MAAVTAAAIGATAAVAGGVMAYKASQNAADATEDAAHAQMTAAQAQLKDQKQARDTALSLAAPSAAELAAIDRVVQRNEMALANSMDQIKKTMSVIDSIDPAIKEAGTQAYDLLKGKSAELMGPVLAQRTRQRQELEGQLAARLGPGFRTTSAGIEALNKFDTATSEAASQTQQQTLLTLGNFFAGTSAARAGAAGTIGDIMRTGQSGEQVALNALGQIKNRQVAAWNGGAPTAGQAVIQAAGNSFAGQIAGADATKNLGTAIGNLGAQGIGFGLGQMTFANQQAAQMQQFNNQLSSLQKAGAFSNMGTAPAASFVPTTLPALGVA